jgi:UDP-N-acetylmuramoyl-tripeptide--D-alanyl-D-alanine ligase
MAEFRLAELAARMKGTLVQGDPDLVFAEFGIDSRLTVPGGMFFAIRGVRDGHDFVGDARARGAAGAVVSRTEGLGPLDARFGLVRVGDTTAALQDLAAGLLKELGPRVVGITGSAGKTTTKEFTATLLGRKYRLLKSEGNFNNHLGLALSLLKLTREHQAAVLEMAMSAPGEILRLTRIAPPDIAVITNISPVHLAFFDGLDAIAQAKKEILDGAKKSAKAVLNADDERVLAVARGFRGDKVLFGLAGAADVRAEEVESRGLDGLAFVLKYGSRRARLSLPFLTESYLQDFLAACGAALALSLGLEEVTARAAELKPFARRGVVHRLGRGIVLVDDSYNSNPRALEAALAGLGRLPARRRVAVLGDMLELGPREGEFHAQAGRRAVEAGWDVLVTVGPLSRATADAAREAGLEAGSVHSFDGSEDASRAVPALLQPGDIVLVKGSRATRTDKIADRILELMKES